jgi:two-component system chemotaxis response regulator CheY
MFVIWRVFMTTILIAEDNRVNQRMLAFTLRKNDYTVITAMHGLEALDQMEATPIDLVIADIDMPEMDGISLVKHLRANKRYQLLPIIVLTASGDDEDYNIARAAGADDVLTKPASSRELISTIEKILKQQ